MKSLDLDEFAADCERLGKAVIDFRGLSPQLKLELQYAVQSRVDAATTRVSPTAVTIAIRYARRRCDLAAGSPARTLARRRRREAPRRRQVPQGRGIPRLRPRRGRRPA